MQKIKLIIFDLDETLISTNSWLKLNTALSISEQEDYTMYKFENE